MTRIASRWWCIALAAAAAALLLWTGGDALAEVRRVGPGGGGGNMPIWLMILCLPFAVMLLAMWVALAIYFAWPIMVFVGANWLDAYTGWGYWWCVLILVLPCGMLCGMVVMFAEELKQRFDRWRYSRRSF